MAYAKYENYKLSNCDWLKEIPTHWDIKRLKNVATYNDDALDENTDPDYEIVYVDISSVSLIAGITNPETIAFEKAPSRARRKVKDGDILISTVRTYLKAITSINEPPENMIASTGFAVIRHQPNYNATFLSYLVKSEGFVGNVVAKSVGVSYPAINASDLARIAVIEPPLEEQQKIAAFLDFKTVQIDALIAKQENLLLKLQDKRLALITQAVTKGINPNAKMKPSGDEWLGDVPAHWEVKKLKFVAHPQPSNVDKKTVEDEIPVRLCNYVDVYKNEFIDLKISFMEASATIDEIYKFKLNIGDVIITKDSETPDDIAVPALVIDESEDLVCGYHLTQIKQQSINGRFLFRLFQSKGFNTQFIVQANGVTRFGLPSYAIDNAFVPKPPDNEQVEIAEYVDEKTASIDTQSLMVKNVMSLLQEYRASLITNTVTGKIDVRDFVVPDKG